ncbi:Hypothetical protein D9617_21g097330 [Elsinoe fawcettii]|nr:Hypothetical protein D9617_21g097330 [Elsinoe fawcettii]
MCKVTYTYFAGCRRHPDDHYKSCPNRHQCRQNWETVEKEHKTSDKPCMVCAESFQGRPGYPQYNPGTGKTPMSGDERKQVIMDAANRMDAHGFRTFLPYFVHTDARTRMNVQGGPSNLDEVDRMGKTLEVWFWSVVIYMQKFQVEDAPEWVQERLDKVEAPPD